MDDTSYHQKCKENEGHEVWTILPTIRSVRKMRGMDDTSYHQKCKENEGHGVWTILPTIMKCMEYEGQGRYFLPL